MSPGGGVDDTGADPLLKARSIALELLARREHSYHELLGKLQDRLIILLDIAKLFADQASEQLAKAA